tara:strand:- start:16795 stop:17010 length:216 start_codon:yes stop_codon:yes gene_type:complete
MGFARSLRRQKQKDAKKKLQAAMSMLDSLPETCSTCAAPFDKFNLETAQNWDLTITETGKMSMKCPTCTDG